MTLKIRINDLTSEDAIAIARACYDKMVEACGPEHKIYVDLDDPEPKTVFRGEETTFDRYMRSTVKE